jgi:hypothetical protein
VRHGGRVAPREYLALDLRAHEMMQGVSLHDVSAVDLPGGGEGRTVGEALALMQRAKPSPVLKGLMALRCAIGDALGWDTEPHSHAGSYVSRVTEADRAASEVPPGTRAGMFRLLYRFPTEALGEIHNATVHGFVSTALVAMPGSYRFYFAVYVTPTSWLTPAYLAAIEPFRRFLVYPAMLDGLRAAWVAAYGAPTRPAA